MAARREESASEATIRYELAVLKKGMGLAVRAEKLDRKPPFPILKVENTRTGFFEPEGFKGYCQLSEFRVKPQQELTQIDQAPMAALHSLKERARSSR